MWHLKRVPELVRDGKHWTPVDTWMVVGEDDGTTRTQRTRDAPKNDRGGKRGRQGETPAVEGRTCCEGGVTGSADARGHRHGRSKAAPGG